MSSDAKTVRRSIYRRQHLRSVFLQGTFCNQPEVAKTSGAKVMTQKVIFMVLDMFDLDLDISRSFDFFFRIHHLFLCMTSVNVEAICS